MCYRHIIAAVYITATLTSCATYKATLTNEKSQTIACERFGPSEILTGYFLSLGLRQKFDDCFNEANAKGFFNSQP